MTVTKDESQLQYEAEYREARAKRPEPNPQPTPDPPRGPKYSTYHVPRAKEPKLQRFYDWLLDHGWRYSARTIEWFTPLDVAVWPGREAFGSFCNETDYSKAWIEPPWDGRSWIVPPWGGPPLPHLDGPLITLAVGPDGTITEETP